MSIRVRIDGAAHSGGYRCECECGTHWHGCGEPLGTSHYSPALPLAEAVAHVRMCHPVEPLDIQFSTRFEDWLESHWRLCSAQGLAHRTDATAPQVRP